MTEPLDFNEYQLAASKTAIYPNRGSNLTYPALGLCGEAGEVAEKVKKLQRDHEGVLTEAYRQELVKEVGDVLWYLAALCSELNVSMGMAAEVNLLKLRSRQERGTLQGNGDRR